MEWVRYFLQVGIKKIKIKQSDRKRKERSQKGESRGEKLYCCAILASQLQLRIRIRYVTAFVPLTPVSTTAPWVHSSSAFA